jgi:hypothetical protein
MKQIAVAVVVLGACAAGSRDPDFHMVGHVDGASGATHVVASTPSHIETPKVAATVADNGSFDLPLTPGYAWSITFVDSHQVGSAMIVGSLAADDVDAFVPAAAGAVDLGNVTFSDRAHASIATGDLVTALGMMPGAKPGATDDLATRYANPDVDNDGILDATQPDRGYRLDFLAKAQLTNGGHVATIDDLVRGMSYIGVAYIQTGIVVSLPPLRDAVDHRLDGAMMAFTAPYYGTYEGAATPVTPAGSAIAAPELRLGTVDGYPTIGAFARGGFDLPRGEYTVALRDQVLTFSDVQPPRAAELMSDVIVPVVQLVTAAPGCVADCPIASIRAEWMRHTDGGWNTVASIGHGAHVDVVRTDGAMVAADLPATPTAEVQWQAMASTMTPAEMATITTSQLRYVALTYTDEVGMQVTLQISN